MTDLELSELIGEERANVATEAERICSIPRDNRSPDDDLSALVEEYTQRFHRPGGEFTLRPVQALSLDVLRQNGGLLGNIGVGAGKTLFGLLAPKVLPDVGPGETVILHPAHTRGTIINEGSLQQKHFEIERDLWIFSYTQLSQPGGYEEFERMDPSLIIADEAHYLRSGDSARTKRLSRFFKRNPETKFVAMSGTLSNRSVGDYAHLAEWALGDQSPLPRNYMDLEIWRAVLDVDNPQNIPYRWYWNRVQPLVDEFGSGERLLDLGYRERKERVREAYQNRFESIPGVVRTSEQSVQCSLYFRTIEDDDVEIPPEVGKAIEDVETRYVLPCGTEIDDPLEKARTQRQLACGFYYRWDWSAVGGVDREWLRARKEWNRESAKIVKYGRADLDTRTLVREAVEAGEYDHRRELIEAWENWKPHRHKDPPPTETVWLSEYLIKDLADRIHEHEDSGRPPLIWYRWGAIARKMSEYGYRVARIEGRDPEDYAGDEHLLVSIQSASGGKNLQQWFSNIVVTVPAAGNRWEQLVGRTHRPGQPSDYVWVDVYHHTDRLQESLESARADAVFVEETKSQPQKILYGDWC